MKEARFYNVGGGVGYAHLWVFGSFFVTPTIGISVGAQRIKWGLESGGEKRSTAPSLNAHIKFGIGMNIRSFFITVDSAVDRFEQNTDSITVGNTSLSSTFSLGARF